MVLGTTIKCPHFYSLFSFIMAQAYENALATGQVVIRRWWFNTNSSRNQVTVQFAQRIERPATAASGNSQLIALEQGLEGLANETTVTALRSFNAEQAQAFFGSTEGDCMQGGTVYFANDLYKSLSGGSNVDVAVQVKENFTRNKYSQTQQPKSNPSTGEVVTALNPATGTPMPVYRHTDLVIASTCMNEFITADDSSASTTPTGAIGRPKAATVATDGELVS